MMIALHNNWWGVRSPWQWQLWHVDNYSSYIFYGLMWDVYIMHGFREPDGKVIRRYDLRVVFQAENIFLGHRLPTSYLYIFTAHFMRLPVNFELCKSRGTVIDHSSSRCTHLYIFYHSTHVVWIIYSDVFTRGYCIQPNLPQRKTSDVPWLELHSFLWWLRVFVYHDHKHRLLNG